MDNIAIYVLSFSYILMFAQQRVLKTQRNLFSDKKASFLQILLGIGTILFFIIFIFLGIEFGWLKTIAVTILLSVIIAPMICTFIPLIYLICFLWPYLLVMSLGLYFFLP